MKQSNQSNTKQSTLKDGKKIPFFTRRWVQFVCISLGYFFFVLGVIGAFLPVFPTTPFLIVAYFCFSKGDPHFHQWFISTSIYKKYLEELVRHRTMPLKRKLYVSIPLTISFIVTSFVFQSISYTIFAITVVVIMFISLFFYIK